MLSLGLPQPRSCLVSTKVQSDIVELHPGSHARRDPENQPSPDLRPIRVQLVASGVYPPDFGGGQLRVHRTLLRMQQNYPIQVEVLAFAGEATQPGCSTIDGLRVYRLARSTNPLGLLFEVGRHLRRARQQGVDVVYVIATGRLAYLTALWARLLGLPLMVEIMNCCLLETRARRLAARFFTRAATLMVAISEPVAREIRTFNVPDNRIWIRPNPVDISRHRSPSRAEHSAERRKLGYAEAHVLHVLAGGIEHRKNQLFAIDIIEALEERHKLLLIGPVMLHDPEYAQRLRERIATSPARDRILLVDRFTDELHRVMYAADCLWMPSIEEGLGNVMLEALCCGVPCVINEALGMDEHIQNGVNGREAPLDPAAWAAAVTSLLPTIRDPDHRRAISEAACRRYDSASFDKAFYRRLIAVARRSAEP